MNVISVNLDITKNKTTQNCSYDILKNKNCLITGATAGIGKAISIELANQGCNLFLTGRNSKQLENIKKMIEKNNPDSKIIIYSADLSKRIAIQKIIKNVRDNFSKIDILVNCAGQFIVKLLENSKLEDYDTSFNINVIAPFILTQEFSKDMKSQRWGRIVNIGSSAAYNGRAQTSIYRSTKHALLGFSRSITKELREYKVRVYCISPGPTKTRMGKNILKKDNPDEDYDTFIDPKDIAKFISNLISFDTELFIQEIRLGRIIGEK
jgi:short-subunit dehydrogenase